MKEKTYEGTKKTQNGLKRMFFSALAILLQALFMVYMFTGLNEYAAAINTTTSVLAIILVLGLYNREQTASMTTPWIILILAFPIMGVSLYLLVGLNGAPNKMRARFEEVTYYPICMKRCHRQREFQHTWQKMHYIRYIRTLM